MQKNLHQAQRKKPLVNQRPNWDGETVVCVATGPSLDKRDLAYIRGRCPVIAINDSHRLAPWADVLYGCGGQWWDWHHGVVEFEGARWTQDERAAHTYGLNYIKGEAGHELSKHPDIIHHGHNSGFQAINLAYHFGARRIVLTGFDMKFSDTNQSHWFGDHPDGKRSNYDLMMPSFESLAKQNLIEIINCTRDTALTMFPRCAITEAV